MAASGLAKLLVNEGVITKSDAKTLKDVSGFKPYSFARALIAIGLFDDEQLTEFVAEFGEYERAPKNLVEEVDRDAIERLPKSLIKHLLAIPIKSDSKTLVVAVPDPLDHAVTERLRFFLGGSIKPVVAPFAEIRATLFQIFGEYAEGPTGFERFLSNFGETAVASIYRRKNPENDALQDLFGIDADTIEGARSGAAVSRRDDVEFSSIDEIDFGDLSSTPNPGTIEEVSRSSASYESDAEADEFVFEESDTVSTDAATLHSDVSLSPVSFEDDSVELASESSDLELKPNRMDNIKIAPVVDSPEGGIEDFSADGDLNLEDLTLEETEVDAAVVPSEEKSITVSSVDSDEIVSIDEELSDELTANPEQDLSNDLLAVENNVEDLAEGLADESPMETIPLEGFENEIALEDQQTQIGDIPPTRNTEAFAATNRGASHLTPTMLAKLSLVNLKLSTVLDLDRAVAVIEKELVGELVSGMRLGYLDSQGLEGELQIGEVESLADRQVPVMEEGYHIERIEGSKRTVLYFTVKDSKEDDISCWMVVKGDIQPKTIVENLQRTLRRLSRHFP